MSAKDLHTLTPQELGKLFPVIISDPNPEWPVLFEKEKKRIITILQDIVRLEHIGSTAVPNLKAKPTIDILLEIEEGSKTERIKTALVEIGYHFIPRSENLPPHMMFTKGYTPEGFKGQAYHIHVRFPGKWDEIYFRDYLRKHPEVVRNYEILKLKLASKYRNDRDGYTEAKSGFIKRINKLAQNEANQHTV